MDDQELIADGLAGGYVQHASPGANKEELVAHSRWRFLRDAADVFAGKALLEQTSEPLAVGRMNQGERLETALVEE